MNRNVLRILLMLIFLISSRLLMAGWVLTGRYIDQDGNTILQRYYIQDYQVKFEQYNVIYTINLKTGELILVDPRKLIYYKGTLESYIEGRKKIKYDQLDKLIREIPADQAGEYQKTYSRDISGIGEPIVMVKDSVITLRQPDSLKIIGQASEKYMVYLNDRKVEELWISPGLSINAQFSWNKYLYFLSVMDPDNATLSYMITQPYMELLNRGFPSRRIMIVGGYRTEFQLNKMEEKEIPAYEFYTPDLCKEVPLEKWLGRDQEKEKDYDDYE